MPVHWHNYIIILIWLLAISGRSIFNKWIIATCYISQSDDHLLPGKIWPEMFWKASSQVDNRWNRVTNLFICQEIIMATEVSLYIVAKAKGTSSISYIICSKINFITYKLSRASVAPSQWPLISSYCLYCDYNRKTFDSVYVWWYSFK